MSVAKVTEIISSSEKGFDDAVKQGIKRANKTLKNVKGAWVQNQQVDRRRRQDHRVPRQSETHLCAERQLTDSGLNLRNHEPTKRTRGREGRGFFSFRQLAF